MLPENEREDIVSRWKSIYPEKFQPLDYVFSKIKRGDRIFIHTACSEPQFLVRELVKYTEAHPKSIADAELMHVVSLGLAPYASQKFNSSFRHNSFFVGNSTRETVNSGFADYTPVFLSRIPKQFSNKMIPIDVALIQVSYPDVYGYVSVGINVDISKAAIENASVVIAQMNSNMPRVLGDTFIHLKEITSIVPYEEELLEFSPRVADDIAVEIARYASKIVKDGDTIQIGYGSIPSAVLLNLKHKNNLGIHSELLSDSMVELIKLGVVDNSKKSVIKGKTVASFCLGKKETYNYIHDNPMFEFKRIDYTNSPIVISRINNMTAINSALQIDLTGQATAESIGSLYYSGIGGSTDFMRSTPFAPGGKTILAIQSTAKNGEFSRIVPYLETGAGVTYNRGDLYYVVTEFGIAYIHGKNIRERAMDLIAIAHPKFRPWLIEEAKRLNLIYKDQAFIPGKQGEYPSHLEANRTTKSGLVLMLRPVNINDEPLIKDFFYSLSDNSLQSRFMTTRKDMPHELRQDFVVIDYTKELLILACVEHDEKKIVVGMGQYLKDEKNNLAEVAFAVRDNYQNMGIASELIKYLTVIAKREGLHGFVAEVLIDNKPMIHVFDKMGFTMTRKLGDGVFDLLMLFGDDESERQIN